MARQQFKHIGNLGYCTYWGKADPDYPEEPKWHPLVYHCLDVAACGQELLACQPAWLCKLAALSSLPKETLLPWLLFLRRTLVTKIHFWPFDGWAVPLGRSVVAEVYPNGNTTFPKGTAIPTSMTPIASPPG